MSSIGPDFDLKAKDQLKALAYGTRPKVEFAAANAVHARRRAEALDAEPSARSPPE
jgi:hypothetical protein